MKAALLLLLLSLLLAACAGPAETTQPPAPGQTPSPAASAEGSPAVTPTTAPPQVLDSPRFGSNLLALEVRSAEGQPVGQVEGMLLDGGSGQIHYMTVTLTLEGARMVAAVPWPVLQLARVDEPNATSRQVLLLNLDPARLADAPPPDPDRLDPEGLAAWSQALGEFWARELDQPAPPDAPQDGALIYVTGGLFGGIDYELADSQERPLGDIRDFIVGASGAVRYAVLRINTFLGLDNSLIPLPWGALRWLPEEQRFLLRVNPDLLQEAPGYRNVSAFPDITAASWDQQLMDFWSGLANVDPAERPALDPTVPVRAAQLLGRLAFSPDGSEIGVIEDLALDSAGAAVYALARTAAGLTPLPLAALTYNPQQRWIELAVEREALGRAPAYDSVEEFPAHPARGWDEDLRAYWGEWVDLPREAENGPAGRVPLLASRIFNEEVLTAQGLRLAVIADLVIASADQATFVVLDLGDKLSPVPWDLFRWDDGAGALVYEGQVEQLEAAPGYESLPQLRPAERGWAEDLLAYWEGESG